MNHELYTIHHFISEEDGKCFFDYQWVDEESIEILKFHNCKGIVEIPERIGSDGWIRGLASGALVLSSSMSLVKIPSTLDKFEVDSITFKNDDKSYGYPSIVVPLRSKAEKYFSSDSYWHARSYYWGHVLTEVFIPSSVICRYFDEGAGIEFYYTLKSEHEAKIVKWIYPKEEIKIPNIIEDNILITDIGSYAFDSPITQKIIIPSTVQRMDDRAVYFEDIEDTSEPIGSLYDLGKNDRDQSVCQLWLTSDVQITKHSFMRETRCKSEQKDWHIENNLIIIALADSFASKLLQENGWKVYNTIGSRVILTYLYGESNSWRVWNSILNAQRSLE